jgi:hypothetical protein
MPTSKKSTKMSAGEIERRQNAKKSDKAALKDRFNQMAEKDQINYIVDAIKNLEVKKQTCAKKKIEFTSSNRAHAICGFKKVMRDHGQSTAKGSKFAAPDA